MVWVSLMGNNNIIGPYVYNHLVNGHPYLQMIDQYVLPALVRCLLVGVPKGQIYATIHAALAVLQQSITVELTSLRCTHMVRHTVGFMAERAARCIVVNGQQVR